MPALKLQAGFEPTTVRIVDKCVDLEAALSEKLERTRFTIFEWPDPNFVKGQVHRVDVDVDVDNWKLRFANSSKSEAFVEQDRGRNEKDGGKLEGE